MKKFAGGYTAVIVLFIIVLTAILAWAAGWQGSYAPAACDINGDGYVDSADVSLFVFDLGKSNDMAAMAETDLNGDGYRDAIDTAILAFNLFKKAESAKYDKIMISTFDEIGGWFGDAALGSSSVPQEGSGYFEAKKSGDAVFGRLLDSIDISKYLQNGRIHLSVYTDKPEYIVGGQIEFTSSGTSDKNEIQWGEFGSDIILQPGWNELELDFSAGKTVSDIGGQSGHPDFRAINYCRIYFNIYGGEATIGVDDFYIYSSKPLEKEIRVDIDGADSLSDGWLSNFPILLGEGVNSPSGTAYLTATGNNDIVIHKVFDSPFDIAPYVENNGYLHLWVYADSAADVYSGQIELTSSGACDQNEMQFGEFSQDIVLKQGWNELKLRLADHKTQGGDPDYSKINMMRVYFNTFSSNITLAIDDIYVYAKSSSALKKITITAGDKSIEKEMFAGGIIELGNLELDEEGYDIIGWTDGVNEYARDAEYIVGDDSMQITAIREEWVKYALVYTDGSGNEQEIGDGFLDETVKTAVNPFTKEGFKFAGWKNGDEIYKQGMSYTVKESNILEAVWEEIDSYNLVSCAQEAWELSDGGPAGVAASAIGRTAADLKWTVWLNNDTFGQVLDFSTAGSMAKVKDSNTDLSGDFTVSVWMNAPIRTEAQGRARTILSGGAAWTLELDKDGKLNFRANKVDGLTSAGDNLADGKWHHIVVSRSGDKVRYYTDGKEIAAFDVSGDITAAKNVYMGSRSNGKDGLDGSLAEVRIYGSAKTPAEVTATVIKDSDNQPKVNTFSVKHGITTDRSQGFGTVGGDFTAQDVINCKNMGFEFIRMMVYVDNLVGENGKLNEEYIEFAKEFCSTIIDNGMPCMMSLGCGDRGTWNGKYLGTEDGFETVVTFYGELAEWIKAQGWTAEQFSLLLFTEPVNATNGTMDWSFMSDRICAAVRNVLPDMTIITSSDNSGGAYELLQMKPVTDPNVVYSFTSYEPYTIGFNTFNGWNIENSPWSYVKDIPYPILEGVDYTAAIENAISDVPENLKEEMRGLLERYVRGEGDAWKPNHFGGLYNADWLMRRAEKMDEWRKANGGNIHIFVAEFGACDAWVNRQSFDAKPSSGISEETRLQLIEDSRRAYDAYDIGWSFWQYNESFTVFRPDLRLGTWCVSAGDFNRLVYPEMLNALGLNYALSR